MIKCIVAIDSKRGMANDKGIPWHLPTDLQYYRTQTIKGKILMGYSTYLEFDHPFHDRLNYVANLGTEPLRKGFKLVKDAREFLKKQKSDVWVIGGAGLMADTLDLIEELHITQLEGDFKCTKFFPSYEDKFIKIKQSDPITENGITYRFTIWHKK